MMARGNSPQVHFKWEKMFSVCEMSFGSRNLYGQENSYVLPLESQHRFHCFEVTGVAEFNLI